MQYFEEILQRYPFVTFLIHFSIISAIFFGVHRFLKNKVKGTPSQHLKALVIYHLINSTMTVFLWMAAFHLAYANLDISPVYGRYERIIFWVMAGIQIFLWLNVVIMSLVQSIAHRKAAEGSTEQFILTAEPVRLIVQFLMASIIIIIVLSMLGVNVTGLVAGLGVGGIALALAVQNILKDLLSALSIALDKPLVPGDFVVLGDKSGTIEKVGLQRTWVRSLSGEQLIFNNNDILSSRINNYKRMENRRIEFRINTTYQTPPDKVKLIPQMLTEIITPILKTRLERAHFKEFGESGLTFESVYWVLDPDFNLYMDIQQRINLELMEHFVREGIEFATPMRTIQIIKDVRENPEGRPE